MYFRVYELYVSPRLNEDGECGSFFHLKKLLLILSNFQREMVSYETTFI